MKSLFLYFAIIISFAACNNNSESTAAKKDSLDSIAGEKKEAIDSSAERKKDMIDSITRKKKESLDRIDSMKHPGKRKDTVNQYVK
jgi:hypothetical protein